MQQSHSTQDKLAAFRQQYAPAHRAENCSQAAAAAGPCPDANSLARLAENRLWWPSRQRLLGHLTACSACADDYRVMRKAHAGMQISLRPQAAGWRGLPQWLQALAAGSSNYGMRPAMLAAAVLLTLATLLLLPTGTHDQGMHDAMLADSGSMPGAGAVVAGADDVLFRSDFDTAQAADQRNDAQAQSLFSDSFGG